MSEALNELALVLLDNQLKNENHDVGVQLCSSVYFAIYVEACAVIAIWVSCHNENRLSFLFRVFTL